MTGSPENPLTFFSRHDAIVHWATGGGAIVHIDMSSHMLAGGGSVFSVNDFAASFADSVRGLPVGTEVHFETKSEIRAATGAQAAIHSHSYYFSSPFGILSDEAFIWGHTSAGFRGTVTVLENSRVYIDGEIRQFNEEFDFSRNTSNPFLEAARAFGHWWTGPGTEYKIHFHGDGRPVNGTYTLIDMRAVLPTVFLAGPECFPASTPIAISLTETRPISDIRIGDTVLAFDPAADLGRGALVPRKVVQLYRHCANPTPRATSHPKLAA